MTRSENYVTTVDHRTKKGQATIQKIRDQLKVLNANRPDGVASRAVALYPRLGPNSPHAHLYAQGTWDENAGKYGGWVGRGPYHNASSQRIRPEHATHTDVYAMPQWQRFKGKEPKFEKKTVPTTTTYSDGRVVHDTFTFNAQVATPLPRG